MAASANVFEEEMEEEEEEVQALLPDLVIFGQYFCPENIATGKMFVSVSILSLSDQYIDISSHTDGTWRKGRVQREQEL